MSSLLMFHCAPRGQPYSTFSRKSDLLNRVFEFSFRIALVGLNGLMVALRSQVLVGFLKYLDYF